ncbi:MAG: NAD-dependent epimerase [Rhodoferax sp.]|nr:NAD-dependent epimerase [Rhodoferax sp.]
MKVLVTGASGYLGRHVLQRLRLRGATVAVLGRRLPQGFEDLELLQADLLETRHFTPLLQRTGATHLLHLAWYAEYGQYWASPLNLRWVDATLRLLQAFGETGGKHAFAAGTCAEYDWSYGYLREDHTPMQPQGLYGTAKDATRRLATALCAAQGVSLAWGHVFYPFGPGEAPKRMLPSLIEVFRGRAPAFGVNTSAFRGMLPVADAAEAFVHLLTQNCNGRFNICSGQPASIEEVVRTLARLCDADPRPVLALASSRAGDPPMLVGDNTRLLATGWRPTQTLAQGLAAQVAQQP